jgi:hypothetical protein
MRYNDISITLAIIKMKRWVTIIPFRKITNYIKVPCFHDNDIKQSLIKLSDSTFFGVS